MVHQACVEQTKVDEKYISEAKNGYIPDVPEIKCYILCLLEFAGAIDEDGIVHFGEVMHLMSPDLKESINKGMEICATKRIHFFKKKKLSKRISFVTIFILDGNTRCETAYLTALCYFELMPEVKCYCESKFVYIGSI